MPTIDFESRVERIIEQIMESEEIHEDNKELIREFKRDIVLEGLSYAWLQKLLSHLKVVAEHLGEQRFEDMEEDDLKDLVEWLQGRDTSQSTVDSYKEVIKRFWQWQYDMPKGEHPEMVDFFTTTEKSGSNGKLPKELLTREDIEALKDACRNPRDRAFIAMLYETGARIGEIIDLTVGDIEDHKHGRKVVIDGKTGERRLPLVESTPPINKWLNDHPDPTDDAPLWSQLRKPEQVSYDYIRQKLLGRAAERAGIDKPVNPHHFRHSRATHLATEFKEAQLCEWFGWVQGSDVPAKYVHLSGRDIDDAYNELHGLSVAEKEEAEDPVQPCPRCEELNEANDRFCSRCGQALDVEAAEELETAEEKTTQSTEPDEVEIAIEMSKAIQSDPDEVAAFVEELDY